MVTTEATTAEVKSRSEDGGGDLGRFLPAMDGKSSRQGGKRKKGRDQK